MLRSLAILVLATWVSAADQVGVWRFGLGTIDGQPAKVGTLVLTGQSVVAADAAPLRLVCSEAPGITFILASGSTGTFSLETAADGGRQLILELATGAVQVDVQDRGPYAGVHVRGAAMDVHVTGTLFVVERSRRDADYIALVHGKVSVGLRPEVAKATGRHDEVQLTDRQGVSADTANGLGKPTDLSARPQIHLSPLVRTPIIDQATGANDQGTPWGTDLAGELTGELLEGLAGGGGPDGGGAAGGPGGAAGGGGLPGDDPQAALFGEVAEDLVDSIGELGQPPQSTTDSVTSGSGAGAPTPLPGPPSLPF
jgi:hypothetical protein